MIYVKIGVSILLGFLMGLEREYSHRYIGIRTVSLVALASTLFCLIQMPGGDPMRIVGQVVTGMGFLGAGVIFKEGASVKGMTTAATLWCASAIGSLVALGYWKEAVAGTVCVIFINLIFKYIKIDKGRKDFEHHDEVNEPESEDHND